MRGPQLKIKNQIMAYRWTFGKDPQILEKISTIVDKIYETMSKN